MDVQSQSAIRAALPLRLIRLTEVRHRTGLSTSTIYRWMSAGKFPRSRRLGGHVAVWLECEVDQWIGHEIDTD